MNWEEIEEKFGKHPDGTIFESAAWAIRVAKHLEKQQKEYNMNEEKNIPEHSPVKPPVHYKKKKDVFRFNGQEDMAIDFDKIYKIVRSGKKITFYPLQVILVPQGQDSGDHVEFVDEESAKNAFDQIINLWSCDVLE